MSTEFIPEVDLLMFDDAGFSVYKAPVAGDDRITHVSIVRDRPYLRDLFQVFVKFERGGVSSYIKFDAPLDGESLDFNCYYVDKTIDKDAFFRIHKDLRMQFDIEDRLADMLKNNPLVMFCVDRIEQLKSVQRAA